MATKTYVKGDSIINATSYELYEKVSEGYNLLETKDSINFEVSALGLSEGDHILVVKAKAEGFEDSDYSNELTYNVAPQPGEPYWISEKLTGATVGSGAASSMLNTQYFYIDDATYVAELEGKTVESIAFATGNKEVASGDLILSLVPLDNTLPSQWQEKATIPTQVTEEEINTIKFIDLETPFVVPSGYTIGYRSTKGAIFGAGTTTGEYKRADKYYDNSTDDTVASINIGSIDFKVKVA